MVSICTGAFALAAAGVLDGLRATTHWQHAAELDAAHRQVEVDPDVLYVDQGQVLSSAGMGAGIVLCLHLSGSTTGRRPPRTSPGAWSSLRIVTAARRSTPTVPCPPRAPSLAATCAWALERLDEPLDVAALARHAGYAPRTFARRFVAETSLTPLVWLSAQRVQLARRLLETTDDAVERRSGLGSAANLRIQLHRDARVSPSAYRLAFRGRAAA